MIGNQLHSRRRVLGRLDLPYSNLTHAYQFDGNSNDAIGSLHGTDINVIYGTAVGANKAAIFAGDGYIDLPQGLRAGASNFTISFIGLISPSIE